MNECKHNWKIIRIVEGIIKGFFSTRLEKVRTYFLQCKKCGDINSRRVFFPNNAKEVGDE